MDGLPDLFRHRWCTALDASYSSGTNFSMSNGSRATGMLLPGGMGVSQVKFNPLFCHMDNGHTCRREGGGGAIWYCDTTLLAISMTLLQRMYPTQERILPLPLPSLPVAFDPAVDLPVPSNRNPRCGAGSAGVSVALPLVYQ